jgi:hypothetical protein
MPDDITKAAEHPFWVPSFGLLVVVAASVLMVGCCIVGWLLFLLAFGEGLGPTN